MFVKNRDYEQHSEEDGTISRRTDGTCAAEMHIILTFSKQEKWRKLSLHWKLKQDQTRKQGISH